MSVNSNPATVFHAAGSKISETTRGAAGSAIVPCWPIGYRAPMLHADINGQRLHLEDLPTSTETGEQFLAGFGD